MSTKFVPRPPAEPAVKNRYRVTYGNNSAVVVAADENEAWAKFCDHFKHWPDPAGRTVRKID